MSPNNTATNTGSTGDILPFTVDVSSEKKYHEMKEIAKKLCPSLVECQQLAVKPLSGGLSNELFVVTGTTTKVSETGDIGVAINTGGQQQQPAPISVLVRIHPSSSSLHENAVSIVDRQVETSVCAWLSSQQIGPHYYGRFQNGRVEEFYPHHVTLRYSDMSVVGPTHIAPIMAHFHALRVPKHVLVPLASKIANHASSCRGDIFHRVRSWIIMAENSIEKTRKDEKALVLLTKLKEHWTWLESALHTSQKQKEQQQPAKDAARKFLREIVFTHMDMQSLNFLRPQDSDVKTIAASATANTNIIKVIDFEYAGFNPRAVDMANTFCEHCDMNNMKADYENEYPSDGVQNAFLKSYIQYTLSAASGSAPQQTEKENQYICLSSYVDDPIFLAAARVEIGRYALVSHLSWAIWSIVQSSLSDIQFDYVAYAQHRLDGFDHMKQRYF